MSALACGVRHEHGIPRPSTRMWCHPHATPPTHHRLSTHATLTFDRDTPGDGNGHTHHTHTPRTRPLSARCDAHTTRAHRRLITCTPTCPGMRPPHPTCPPPRSPPSGAIQRQHGPSAHTARTRAMYRLCAAKFCGQCGGTPRARRAHSKHRRLHRMLHLNASADDGGNQRDGEGAARSWRQHATHCDSRPPPRIRVARGVSLTAATATARRRHHRTPPPPPHAATTIARHHSSYAATTIAPHHQSHGLPTQKSSSQPEPSSTYGASGASS